jgi:hypothetical protein
MSDTMFGGGGQPFDPAQLNAEIDAMMAGHRGRMGMEEQPPPAQPAPENLAGEGAAGAGTVPPTPAPATPQYAVTVTPAVPVVAPPPAPSPLLGVDADEQAELIVLARALRDPERAAAVRQAALGVQPQAAPPVPAPPAEEPLPEHIDPDSIEAQLWRTQQTQLAEIRAMRQDMNTQAQQVAQQESLERARIAAQATTAKLVSKYGHVLSAPEIEAVCKAAASRGWVDAMVQARGGEQIPGALEAGMMDALEAVIRGDDGLLSKVLGGPVVGIPPPAVQPGFPPVPTAQPPYPQPVYQPPVPGQQHSPEAAERQRMLTALSTGASPTGMAPQRAAMEVDRAAGGRMTEASKQALISEVMATGFRQEIEGG